MVQIHSPRPILLEPAIYSIRKKAKTSWLWARHSFFKSPAGNQSFSSEFSVLR